MTIPADTDRATRRERARKLIRDLLAKTVENGCTENESIKAAAKASDLMQQYNLTMADAQDVEDDIYGARKRQYRNNNHEIIRFSSGSIAAFCDCRCYHSSSYVAMFGQQHDTEIAHYLLDLVINAANAEWKRFAKLNGGATPRSRRGFMLGFGARVNARLKEIREARRARVSPTGTDLVVVKTDVVNKRYIAHTQDLRMSKPRPVRSTGDVGAYVAGDMAGRNVNITTGINPGSMTLKLEQ